MKECNLAISTKGLGMTLTLNVPENYSELEEIIGGEKAFNLALTQWLYQAGNSARQNFRSRLNSYNNENSMHPEKDSKEMEGIIKEVQSKFAEWNPTVSMRAISGSAALRKLRDNFDGTSEEFIEHVRSQVI